MHQWLRSCTTIYSVIFMVSPDQVVTVHGIGSQKGRRDRVTVDRGQGCPKSKKAYHGQKRSGEQTPRDCGCTEGLACFQHYAADGGEKIDRELLPWEDHGVIEEALTRIPKLAGSDDGEDEPRDWSTATVVRGPSGLSRIDFTA